MSKYKSNDENWAVCLLSKYAQNKERFLSVKMWKKNSFHFVNIAASLTENLLWGIERVVSAIFIPFLNSKVDHSCSSIISNCHSSIVDSEMKLSYLQIGRGWTGKFFFFTNNKHLIRFCKNEENQKIFWSRWSSLYHIMFKVLITGLGPRLIFISRWRKSFFLAWDLSHLAWELPRYF